MFWKKAAINKPTDVPSIVGKRIVQEMQKLPHTSDHWVTLKAVLRPHEGKPDAFDFRVFDQWIVEQKKVKVENWASLDTHPELIEYEGWYDNKSKKVEVTVKPQTAAPAPAPAAPAQK